MPILFFCDRVSRQPPAQWPEQGLHDQMPGGDHRHGAVGRDVAAQRLDAAGRSQQIQHETVEVEAVEIEDRAVSANEHQARSRHHYRNHR